MRLRLRRKDAVFSGDGSHVLRKACRSKASPPSLHDPTCSLERTAYPFFCLVSNGVITRSNASGSIPITVFFSLLRNGGRMKRSK